MLLYYGYGLYYGIDPTYILVIIAAVLAIFASTKVNSTFNKYAKVRSTSGITGAEAARKVLQYSGVFDVAVEHVSGNLTDHYDPRTKVLRLSDATYNSDSVAAIGVAAHECGHAIQHAESYAPLKIRGAIVPVANFGSKLAWPIIILGVILGGSPTLINIGIWLFVLVVLFQLITLPVEFNASNRAVKMLGSYGILHDNEILQTKKVLSAAALTYVASAAGGILQLLRLVLLFGGGRSRD